ncbi:MAG TPA: hypothetical protein VNA88_03190 [Candidatus Kapabacteria bacterium]|jgi:hypothetical protein|nr:hypothetical protein [Candidatus Kapabacteria bacterium]
MSRLSRYRRGSLVPHLIALTLLLAGVLLGAGGGGDESPYVALAATPEPDGGDGIVDALEPDGLPERGGARIAGLDTVVTPGARTSLGPNSPNPFSESTRIDFSLAARMNVTLTVYDFWYGEVETLIDNEEMEPGAHFARFSVAASENGSISYSGMYFYELRAGGEIYQRRMLVIK